MTDRTDHLDQFANLDLLRAERTGVPEVILAERKTPEQTLAIARRVLEERGRVLLSRVSPETRALLERELGDQALWTRYAEGRTLALQLPGAEPPAGGGCVGVITAGTSDIPVAEEALETLRMCGVPAVRVFDVGVAGLHRLLARLDVLTAAPAAIVVAGMEGALPSVVGGLVATPIVAVPTSVGYGTALGGITALFGMLTSCASGITVVNIDNGFGAAAAVVRMLRARSAA